MNDKLKADMRAATARNDTIVLSGKMHTSDAEREAVLKASAMLSLADMVDDRRLYAQAEPVRLLLTKRECDLIAYALRHTADSE